MTDEQAVQYIAERPALAAAVEPALMLRKPQDRPTCSRMAAVLWRVGWMQSNPAVPVGTHYESHVHRLVKDARRTLSDVDALPRGGILGLGGWFLLHFVVLPFLGDLIRNWIFRHDD